MALDPVRVLNRAPRWVRKAVSSVTQGRGLAGRIYDRFVHRYAPDQVPTVPARSEKPVRLLIGPANEAAQGYLWARAFEGNLPGVSAAAMMGFDPAGYEARSDLRVPTAVYLRSREWHSAFEQYLDELTHILFESALPLLGRRYHSDAFAEMSRFVDHGIRTGVIFHGSDLRLPSQHMRESRWSPFTNPSLPVALLEDRARQNIERVTASAAPTFVSTPDLLRYLPHAKWCPVVIDPTQWQTTREARIRLRPVVFHAPSNPLIKGSLQIEPVLRELETEGLIEYRSATGLKHEQMRQQYADADIVLDQFLIGSYGVAACEAMAAGCLVVGHVDQRTRALVRELTGENVPIIEASVEELDAVLRDIVQSPDRYIPVRDTGIRFVEDVHDGRRSAASVAEFLGVAASD